MVQIKRLVSFVFFVLVFATVVLAQKDMSDRIGELFDTLINMFSKTLGVLFTAVSKSPYVWLKVFMALIVGVVIHWVLSHVLHDRHGSDQHSKYINIISFVAALAIVAFTPDNLLRFIFALYGGLIFGAFILIPFFVLGHYSWQVKKTKVTYVFLAIMWLLYIGLVSAMSDLGTKSIPEFRGAVNDTIKLIISICMAAAFVLLIKDLSMALLSKGASAAAPYAGAAGSAVRGAVGSAGSAVGAGAKGLFGKLFGGKEEASASAVAGGAPAGTGGAKAVEENKVQAEAMKALRLHYFQEINKLFAECRNVIIDAAQKDVSHIDIPTGNAILASHIHDIEQKLGEMNFEQSDPKYDVWTDARTTCQLLRAQKLSVERINQDEKYFKNVSNWMKELADLLRKLES